METPALPPASGQLPSIPHVSWPLVWRTTSRCSRCWGQPGGVIACTPGPHPPLLPSPHPSTDLPLPVACSRNPSSWPASGGSTNTVQHDGLGADPLARALRELDLQTCNKAHFWPGSITPCKVQEHQWGGLGQPGLAAGHQPMVGATRQAPYFPFSGWSWRWTLALAHFSDAETEAQRG